MQDDDPFLGELAVGEYFALPDEERERIWAELHLMEIDDFEEILVLGEGDTVAK